MTANQSTGYAGKEVSEDPTRVTARAMRTEAGEVHVEYEYWGWTYTSAEALEAAMRGESWD